MAKYNFESSREYIIEQYRSGKSTNKLAKEFNCNSGTIYLFLKNCGVEIKKKQQFIGKIEDYIPQMKKLYEEGLSSYKIAKEISISEPTVLRTLQELGFDTSQKSTWKNPIRLKDKSLEIKSLADDGLTSHEIAKQTGYSQSNIWKLLTKEGYNLSDNIFKYDVNSKFFDVIDTIDKAYILGWWYSDGNVMLDRIRLQITDKEILEYIKEQIKFTGPIRTVPPQVEGRQVQYELCITRKELADSITKLGCPPNKSLILDFPSKEIVPDKFINAFILGWFNGDGNIYYHKGQDRWKAQLTGTKEFLEGIQNVIGISGYWSQRFPERKNNNYSLQIAVQEELIKFLEFIYIDNIFSLDRKKVDCMKCLLDLKERKKKRTA